MLEKFKGLFARKDMPQDAKQAFAKAKDAKDLLRALDDVRFNNELESRKAEREINALEARVDLEAEKIRKGGLTDAQKRVTLQGIKRVKDEITSKNAKVTIHSKNMTLMTNLMGKIEQIDAMGMRGIDAPQIDAIIASFDENFEKYQDVVMTSEALSGQIDFMTTREQAELDALEREIMGVEAPAREKPVKERATAQEKPDVENEADDDEQTDTIDVDEMSDGELEAELERQEQAVLSEEERAELAELERDILSKSRRANEPERTPEKPRTRELEAE